jgi:putative nucleotidyltransferase with HDIG domain
MNHKQILQQLDHARNLPTLPTIALKVNEMLKDYDVSVDQLTRVIEKDQAIVIKLLKLVNSAFFGFKSKIKNIPHAVTLMGYNTLRNAVITVSVIDAFKVQDKVKGLDVKEFWTHSIQVAVYSKYLSEDSKLMPTEEAFTFGLLHDIGKMVQLITFPDLCKRILSEIETKKISYHNAERELDIMSHARIGAYLAKKWFLPQDLVDVLKYHHNIKEENSNYDQLIIVHVADLIVNTLNGSKCPDHQLGNLDTKIKNILLNTLKRMPTWCPKAEDEIKTACQFFMEG